MKTIRQRTTNRPSTSCPSFRSLPARTALLAIGAISLAPAVLAQEIVAQKESQLDTPSAERLIQAENAAASLDPKSPDFLNPNTYLTWGPVTARPHLVTRFSYGNNLRSVAGRNSNTVIEEISPGSLFELGKKWRLDYTPTLSFYSSKDFKDTLGHNVSLVGDVSHDDWAFRVSQLYTLTSQPLVETGRQTEQESFLTLFNATHHFSSRLMLDLGVNQNFLSAQQFTGSKTWSTMDWLNWQSSPRLSFGAGIGGGFQLVSNASDMSYEQFQGRVDARIAQKLTLSLHGGGEVRQIIDSGADSLINPIFGASIIYHPFEVTTLSLSGNRAINPSLLQGEVTESTDISAALTQRLLGVVYLTLSGSYGNTRYIVSNSLLALSREDNILTFSSNLTYPFTLHGSAAIFYTHSDNSSTAADFNYSSHQVGLELAYRF
jgi:hypothetical protein